MANPTPDQSMNRLTEREQEILRLLATGTSNKDIARQLFISSNTVKVHLRNIFAKTGVSTRTEAAMYAVRTGLSPQPQPEASISEMSTLEMQPVSVSGGNGTAASQPGHAFSPYRWAIILIIILLVLITAGVAALLLRPRSFQTATNTPLPAAVDENRWNALAPLPLARYGFALAAYGNQIYVIGGESTKGVTPQVQHYDPATDSWKDAAQKPTAVADVNAALLGGKIYVPGGRTFTGDISNKLEIYDPHQDKWEEGPTLPTPLSAYALAVFEGRMYIFGGWDGTNYLDKVYIFQPETGAWSEGKPMPTARRFAGATIVDGKVYVIGGENKTGKLAANEVLDLGAEGNDAAWKTDLPLPAAVSSINLVNVADVIYAVVGDAGKSGIYVYHAGSGNEPSSWTALSMPDELGHGFGAVLMGSRIYIMGGNNGQPQALNTAYNAIYTIILPILSNGQPNP